MEKNHEYKRVGTTYYKIIHEPNLYGDTNPIMTPWNLETIKHDHGREFLSTIPKYDGFCFIPNHINYKEEYSNFINQYKPLVYHPYPGQCEKILLFLKHIFKEQLEVGLDYLQILYHKPVQRLPILCLVSKERNTGKTTFLMFLKSIFQDNMTINTNEDFRSQFNSHWANKLIIGVDEVLLDKREDTERIKNLSTSKKYKTEAKGKDRQEIDFIGKFILCSNNEVDFIRIDPLETRFWVIKVDPFEKENENLHTELEQEIPHFLYFLLHREMRHRNESRMWFKPEVLKTDALLKIKHKYRNKIELELLEILADIMDAKQLQKICFTNGNAIQYLKRSRINISRTNVSELLTINWKLTPQSNSLMYTMYHFDSADLILEQNVAGRYYTVTQSDILKIKNNLMN